MPDFVRNGRYRVEMETSNRLVPARKRKNPIQRAETPNFGHNELCTERTLHLGRKNLAELKKSLKNVPDANIGDFFCSKRFLS